MNFDDYTNDLSLDSDDASLREAREHHLAEGARISEALKAEKARIRAAYNAEEARIRAKFEQDVLAELGLTDHPKGQALMDLAWDKGHSSGYSDVYNEAVEMAVLLQDD